MLSCRGYFLLLLLCLWTNRAYLQQAEPETTAEPEGEPEGTSEPEPEGEGTPEPEPEPEYNVGERTEFGVYIGWLMNKADKGVSGEVFALDNHRLHIKDFTYDGKGPDAYFYVATRASGSMRPEPKNIIIPDENGRKVILGRYHKSVVLNLPDGMMVTDIAWFSIWCEFVGVDFGSLIFPALSAIGTLPAMMELGDMTMQSNGVSGTVTVHDKRKISISCFKYDGAAADATFWAGTGAFGSDGFRVRDQYNRGWALSEYDCQDIVIVLPRTRSVDQIEYLMVWDLAERRNLGYIMIPQNLDVPIHANNVGGYYGEYIGRMDNSGVEGNVFAVDNHRLRVRYFNFDGQAPDTFFYFGKRGEGSATPEHGGGEIIYHRPGSMDRLGAYMDGDLVLTLPDGVMTWDVTWFAVWCREAEVIMAELMFPHSMYIPMTENLGQFDDRPTSYGVMSDDITILDTRRIHIKNFFYNGNGPDAFMWLGQGAVSGDGWPIPDGKYWRDESMAPVILGEFTGEDVTLLLPQAYTVYDSDYLSVWCRLAGANFGSVTFPTDLYPPPYLGLDMMSFSNCEQMNEFFSVGWMVDGNDIYFEFVGGLEPDGYMAFGLSGSDTGVSMGGGDVSIAMYMDNEAKAQDFFLSAYSQCSNGNGVCRDDQRPQGMNDVMQVSGFQRDGVTTVRFKRPLTSADSNDKSFTPGTAQSIIWSMGPLTPEGIVLVHNKRILRENPMLIDFGRDPEYNCQAVQPQVIEEFDPWRIPQLDGPMSFRITIGPSGGEQGYKGITGSNGWGIALYVNGWLIPELVLYRGMTYTFVIEAGDNPNNNAEFHPVYITDDPIGGYAQKSRSEQMQERVFFGIDSAGQYTAAGRFCGYQETTLAANDAATFEEYKDSLTEQCQAGDDFVFNFSPDDNTPDLLYYQCYQHKYLGWKIHIEDMPEPSGAPRLAQASFVGIVAMLLLRLL